MPAYPLFDQIITFKLFYPDGNADDGDDDDKCNKYAFQCFHIVSAAKIIGVCF